jgi:hypothetical protein
VEIFGSGGRKNYEKFSESAIYHEKEENSLPRRIMREIMRLSAGIQLKIHYEIEKSFFGALMRRMLMR